MIVLKFGGTSLGSAQRIKEVANLVLTPEPKIVVLSAMSGTNKRLQEVAICLLEKDKENAANLVEILRAEYLQTVEELFSSIEFKSKGKDLIKSHFDYLHAFTLDSFTLHEEKAILAQGALLSTALFHLYLAEISTTSVLLPALSFMRIDKALEPDYSYIKENLNRLLAKNEGDKLFITQGFICRNVYGQLDNLKRGGSDYTASLIGVALQANEVQMWSDNASSMYNNDPLVVNHVHSIKQLTFDEAAELAYFHENIPHPSSISPAKKASIPVRLKSTLAPDSEGTLITTEPSLSGIKAVAAKDHITAFRINSSRMLLAHGFLRQIFEIFELYKTPIDMISTSEVAVSMTIDNSTHLEAIQTELAKYGDVEVNRNHTIICIVGNCIRTDKDTANQIFDSLKEVPIRLISYGGSDHNISILVDTEHKKVALQNLNTLLS